MAGKLLAAQSIEGNPLKAIEELRQRVAASEDGSVNAATLSDITPHAGQLQDLSLLVNEDFDDAPTELQFITPDGTTIAEFDAAHIDSSLSGIIMLARAKTSAENGIAAMQAFNNDGTVSTTTLVQSDGRITYNYKSVIHAVHHGEAETYLKVADTNETSVAYTSIPAGAMGINGRVNMRGYVLAKNNKGSSGTITLIVYFGTKSVTFVSADAINNSATTRKMYWFDVEVVNTGAANAQNILVRHSVSTNFAAESVATGPTAYGWWTTAAIDTSAGATDFKVNIDLSATDAAFFAESSGEFSGAYGTYS